MKTRRNNLIRTAVLSVFSLLVLLGIAPTANAATVGYAWWTSTAYYVAAPGEANNLTVAETPGFIVFSDPNATVTAQFGCTVVDAHSARCSSNYVHSLYLKADDLDDVVALQVGQLPTYLDCGTGTDSLNTQNPNTNPSNCEYVNAPPPTPAPVNPPAAITPPPPLSILQPVATMTKNGSVPLTLSCSASAEGPCTGTVVFELPARLKKGQVGAARRGAPNILGREKITVERGKKRTVKISMTGKGRSMVTRSKKLKVTAKLKIKQAGNTTTSAQSLTIRASRR